MVPRAGAWMIWTTLKGVGLSLGALVLLWAALAPPPPFIKGLSAPPIMAQQGPSAGLPARGPPVPLWRQIASEGLLLSAIGMGVFLLARSDKPRVTGGDNS